jgi:hypothetical protein
VEREEVTWKQLPRETVTIVPKKIPKTYRVMEADTTAIYYSKAARTVGPMVSIKWQLHSWDHQPAGEIAKDEIPEAITLPQLIGGVVQKIIGRIMPQDRFRIQEEIPDEIPQGYLIKVERMALPSLQEVLRGVDTATLLGPESKSITAPPEMRALLAPPEREGTVHKKAPQAQPPKCDKITVYITQEK